MSTAFFPFEESGPRQLWAELGQLARASLQSAKLARGRCGGKYHSDYYRVLDP